MEPVWAQRAALVRKLARALDSVAELAAGSPALEEAALEKAALERAAREQVRMRPAPAPESRVLPAERLWPLARGRLRMIPPARLAWPGTPLQ